MTSQEVIQLLSYYGNQINSYIINTIMLESKDMLQSMQDDWNEYLGEVPITERTFTDTNKINEKLANDFRGLISDTKTGYFLGNPISYKSSQENTLNKINDYVKANSLQKFDTEVGLYASICGYGSRLCYIDTNGIERIMTVNPWETIFINDIATGLPQHALRVYQLTYYQGVTKSYISRVEWYNDKTIQIFESDLNTLNYKLVEEKPHGFDAIPLIQYKNNLAYQSDFKKVEALIDAYDITLSDIQNEIEEFRIAYMMFYGVNIDSATILEARRSGAFSGLQTGDKVEYLTKNLDSVTNFLESQKKTLKENIFNFSKSVDFTDEKFASAQSGESRKFKLLALENDTILKEREFEYSQKRMFEILNSVWVKKSVGIDLSDLEMVFTRNLPIDLANSADIAVKLNGIISQETLFGLMPFISDPQAEIEKKQAEQDNTMVSLNDATTI